MRTTRPTVAHRAKCCPALSGEAAIWGAPAARSSRQRPSTDEGGQLVSILENGKRPALENQRVLGEYAAPAKGIEPSSLDRQSNRLTRCVRGQRGWPWWATRIEKRGSPWIGKILRDFTLLFARVFKHQGARVRRPAKGPLMTDRVVGVGHRGIEPGSSG